MSSVPRPAVGKVYLVGAGPGDPGLITVRAVECLRHADLVLYDGLVNPLLLRYASGLCERTARIRTDGQAVVPQQQINDRLITEARAGRTVVRLKGGDPCIFGRGSEEAEALYQAGIPYEIVPGITAATAAAEYAGFSLTHRDVSSAVAFVTGHENPQKEASRLDDAGLASFPGTLVFYMGLARLNDICQRLIRAGRDPQTPAAVVCHASLPSQRVVTGTLQSLPLAAASEALHPPSLIVVGSCVLQRQLPSWFEKLPLFGVSIGITRPTDQCYPTADQIVRLGGEPVLMPLIEIASVDQTAAAVVHATLRRLAEFQWLIFTSVNGVSEFIRHLWQAGLDARALRHAGIAAIGSSTAAALKTHLLRADLVPEQFRAESLAAAMAPYVAGKKCLWLRASRGRDVLPQLLVAAGAAIEELVVYENRDADCVAASAFQRMAQGQLHWVGLSSPSIARQFAAGLAANGIAPQALTSKLVTISPVTSAAASEAGLTVSAEAVEYTWDGMLQAIIRTHKQDPAAVV